MTALAFACAIALAGCLAWSEDSEGNLRSVGLPGIPVWQAKDPPPPPRVSPSQLGMTPEEASKMGGPVLVMPPEGAAKSWRYRYYDAGNNHCQRDLQQILAYRASQGL